MSPLANIVLDGAGSIRQWNAPAERLFGHSGEAACGRCASTLYSGERESLKAVLVQAAKAGSTDHEGTCVRSDGGTFAAHTLVTVLRNDGKLHGYSLVVRELSRPAASLSELRALHDSRLAAVEAERIRIARVLRDKTVDALTALRMDLERLARGAADSAARVEGMKRLTESAIATARGVAGELRPAELDNLGLAPAVEQLLQGVAERSGARVKLDTDMNNTRLQEPLLTGVYRLVEEAVSEVPAITQATELSVAMTFNGSSLKIGVRGNGGGPVDLQTPVHGHGVLGIEERARALGGILRVTPLNGGGTEIHIQIPDAHRGAITPPM